MVTEALLGAALVKFELVTTNDSPWRAVAMGLHFLNSLLLMASLTLTWDFSKNTNWLARDKNSNPWTRLTVKPKTLMITCVLGFLVLGSTGAIAALSNSLFPSTSLLDGFMADWQAESHYLIRLRGLHPLMGILIGSSLALAAWLSASFVKDSEILLQQRAKYLAGFTACGVVFGIMTLVTLAPAALKMTHLALAHGIWVFLVLWMREIVYREA